MIFYLLMFSFNTYFTHSSISRVKYVIILSGPSSTLNMSDIMANFRTGNFCNFFDLHSRSVVSVTSSNSLWQTSQRSLQFSKASICCLRSEEFGLLVTNVVTLPIFVFYRDFGRHPFFVVSFANERYILKTKHPFSC